MIRLGFRFKFQLFLVSSLLILLPLSLNAQIPTGFQTDVSGSTAAISWSLPSRVSASGVSVPYRNSRIRVTGPSGYSQVYSPSSRTDNQFTLTDLSVGTYTIYGEAAYEKGDDEREIRWNDTFEIKQAVFPSTFTVNTSGSTANLSWLSLPSTATAQNGATVSLSSARITVVGINYDNVFSIAKTATSLSLNNLRLGTYSIRGSAIYGSGSNQIEKNWSGNFNINQSPLFPDGFETTVNQNSVEIRWNELPSSTKAANGVSVPYRNSTLSIRSPNGYYDVFGQTSVTDNRLVLAGLSAGDYTIDGEAAYERGDDEREVSWSGGFTIRVSPTPNVSTPSGFVQPSHNPEVGGLAGQHSVELNGSASYRIPIDIIGVRKGLAPELAFSYNSTAGLSAMGIGWTLSGFSAIQRCPTSHLRGEIRDPVDFDSNDQFCLNSVRLVRQPEGDYRLENDDGTRVIVYGALTNPSYFKVLMPNGRIQFYGNSSDSAISPMGSSLISTWALNREEDRYSNFYNIEYTKASGSYRPHRVNYNGHGNSGTAPSSSVRFYYANDRQDTQRVYLGGAYAEQNWRLTKVEVFSGSRELRRYSLKYNHLTRAPRSPYITSIEKCTYSEEYLCMPETTFSWSSENFGYSSISNWLSNNTAGIPNEPEKSSENRFIDLNGDGYPDRIWRPKGRSDYYVALNTKSRLGTPTRWINSSYYVSGTTVTSASDEHQWFADINGDGLIDRVWDPNGSNNHLYISVNSGSQFNTPTKIFNHTLTATNGVRIDPRPNDGRNYFVDFDGDGRVDRVWMPKGRSDFYLSLNNGNNTFSQPRQVLNSTIYDPSVGASINSYSHKNQFEYFQDVNGDGLPDRFWIPDGRRDIHVALNNGLSNFSAPKRWLADASYSYRIYSTNGSFQWLTDVNGDGLPDWLFAPEGNINEYYVALNTGVGLSPLTKWLARSGFPVVSTDGKHTDLGDFNGDGLPDIIWEPDGGVNGYYVALNTGRSFDNPLLWQSNNANGITAFSKDGSSEYLLDMNGDGAVDRVWSPDGSNNNYYVARGKTNYRQINSVEVGNGDTVRGHFTQFLYKSGLDTSLVNYSSYKGTFPYNVAPSANRLVYRTNISDGIGGHFHTDYSYSNPKIHLGGYANLGFESMTVKNGENGIETRTIFNQDASTMVHGTVREVRTVATSDPNDPVLSVTTNSWINKTLGSGGASRNRLELAATTITKRDLNNSFINSEVNNYTYEPSAGMPLTIETKLYGEHSFLTRTKKVTNTYASNHLASTYLLPSLTKTRVDVQTTNKAKVITLSAWEYDAQTGKKLKEKILHPDTEAVLSETRYHNIDTFGNHRSTTTLGSDFKSRTSTQTFDATGRFVTSQTNPLGQISHAFYHGIGSQFDGMLYESRDINGIRTRYEYDGFGRETKMIAFYGSAHPVSSYTSYQWCSADF